MKKRIWNPTFVNQSGQAELIGVLLAAVVSGLIMMSTAQMFHSLNLENKAKLQRAAGHDLARELEIFLSIQNNCNSTFANQEMNGQWRSDLDLRSGPQSNDIIYDIAGGGQGMAYANGHYRMLGMRITEQQSFDAVNALAKVEVRFAKATESIGSPEIVKEIRMIVTKTGTTINSCYALVGANTDVWVRSAANPQIIHSTLGPAGFVGINKNAPTERLDIDGNILVDTGMTVGAAAIATNANVTGNLIVSHPANQALAFVGIGVANPTSALHMIGDAYLDGTATFTTQTTAVNITTNGNATVGGNLTVSGATQLNTMTVTGAATLGAAASNSRFGGATTFFSPVRTLASLAVGQIGFAPAGYALYVNGDTNVTGNVSALTLYTPQLCINGDCRTTFATQNCPAGMIKTLNTDGTVQCDTPTCSVANSYMTAATGGAPNCSVIPTANCTNPNEYIHQVNPTTGAVLCQDVPGNASSSACAGNTYITGIAGGTASCDIPRIPASSCPAGTPGRSVTTSGGLGCSDPGVGSATCTVNQVAIGTNADGSIDCRSTLPAQVNCPAGQVATGVDSGGNPVCGAFSIQGGLCPVGQVVNGLNSNGTVSCIDAPTIDPCPVGTSYAGIGEQASPPACFCNNSGELWNGASCYQPAVVCSNAGTSTTGAGGPASPAGCFCNTAGETWNGYSCVAPPAAWTDADLDACRATAGDPCVNPGYYGAFECFCDGTNFNGQYCTAGGTVGYYAMSACGGGYGGSCVYQQNLYCY